MSKTVKGVSETAKRVTRVMMIGLVAMLGAEAEAHWVVVRGKCYWHSLECVREDTEVPDPVPILFPPLVELVASPIKVEGLCPDSDGDGVLEVENIPLPNNPVILATPRTRIDQRDITERRGTNSRYLEVERIVSDALFYTTSCSSGLSPIEVIVRVWSSVEMNLYLNSVQPIPHSAWRAGTCTLPDEFHLTDPINLPPPGALYKCGKITTCHANNC